MQKLIRISLVGLLCWLSLADLAGAVLSVEGVVAQVTPQGLVLSDGQRLPWSAVTSIVGRGQAVSSANPSAVRPAHDLVTLPAQSVCCGDRVRFSQGQLSLEMSVASGLLHDVRYGEVLLDGQGLRVDSKLDLRVNGEPHPAGELANFRGKLATARFDLAAGIVRRLDITDVSADLVSAAPSGSAALGPLAGSIEAVSHWALPQTKVALLTPTGVLVKNETNAAHLRAEASLAGASTNSKRLAHYPARQAVGLHFRGPSGGQGSFSLPGAFWNLPAVEISPGFYAAVWCVPPGLDIRDTYLQAALDCAGRRTSRLSSRLSLAGTPPVCVSYGPQAAGASGPVFAVFESAGSIIDAQQWHCWVDGKKVTGKCKRSVDGLVYWPGDWGPGEHLVRLSVSDYAGQSTELQWKAPRQQPFGP